MITLSITSFMLQRERRGWWTLRQWCERIRFLRSWNLCLGRAQRELIASGSHWIISILRRATRNNAFMCRKTGPGAARFVDLRPYPFAAEWPLATSRDFIPRDAGECTIRDDPLGGCSNRCIAAWWDERRGRRDREREREREREWGS